MGMGAAVLVMWVRVGLGVAASILYARAYSRAGYDDWGNYLALLPFFGAMLVPFSGTPIVGILAIGFTLVGLFATPCVIWMRRRAGADKP